MSDVRTFKMVSGEEVITRVEGEDENNVTFAKPRVLALVPVGQGQVQVQMIPYVASNPDCTIKIARIAIGGEIDDPARQLVDGYMEQTTGIALA